MINPNLAAARAELKRKRELARIEKSGPELRKRTETGLVNINTPLTEQQRVFVTFYAEHGLNGSAAARHAGYSNPGKAAQDLLKNPKIQHAVAIEREKTAEVSKMSRQKVIDGFVEAIEMARVKADPLVMISGYREIGKMCGFYEPSRLQVEVSVQGKIALDRLSQMTDEELLKIAQESGEEILDGEFVEIEDEPES